MCVTLRTLNLPHVECTILVSALLFGLCKFVALQGTLADRDPPPMLNACAGIDMQYRTADRTKPDGNWALRE